MELPGPRASTCCLPWDWAVAKIRALGRLTENFYQTAVLEKTLLFPEMDQQALPPEPQLSQECVPVPLVSHAGILDILQQTQQQIEIAPAAAIMELPQQLELFMNTYPMDSGALDLLQIEPAEVLERFISTFKPPAAQADLSKTVTDHVKFLSERA